MQLSKNAKFILKKRFLKKDKNGRIVETPEAMFKRVAQVIANADRKYDKKSNIKKIAKEFYQVMTNLEFLPNAPTLRNAGRELGQLAACFVLPIPDSIEGIFEAVKEMAIIQKTGGGTGFSFSRLRPEGSLVKATLGIASGPVSFMKVFDTATGAIKEGGVRRGANMGILRVDHPDILKFITCKKKEGDFSNFNISVALTDKFINAVRKNTKYNLINPRTRKIVDKISARKVFNLICKMAWLNGEPGIIFIDEINRHNPTPKLGKIEATNPCGEQPLLPNESCNLGSINLTKFVENKKINWQKLKRIIKIAVHFLDNVIDVNIYPLKSIEKLVKANRKIGLGVMGFADLLIALGVPYNSEKAEKLAKKIMKFIQEEAHKTSEELAKKRGVFPNWKKSIYYKKVKLRNATLTTIAPTGTLSIIANCSASIEPIYAPIFTKYINEGVLLSFVNPYFKEIAKRKGFYSRRIFNKIFARGTIRGIKEIPKNIKNVFVSAHDILPEWHIRIQAAFQKYTDNAVAKTINLPKNAKVSDIKKIILFAHKLKVKGLTVYRDQSRKEQILNTCKCKI